MATYVFFLAADPNVKTRILTCMDKNENHESQFRGIDFQTVNSRTQNLNYKTKKYDIVWLFTCLHDDVLLFIVKRCKNSSFSLSSKNHLFKNTFDLEMV